MTDTNKELYGQDLFGDSIVPPSRGTIADNFLIPPFTVLSARDGFWQQRKRAWIDMGIKSEVSREDVQCFRAQKEGDFFSSVIADRGGNVSIFDPTLCELIYRWFCGPDAMIVDPFAGGSVRGVVAAVLGRKYYGIDLRQEQVDANDEQAAKICPDNLPVWVCGDAMDMLEDAPWADLIFTCPPYGDLEVYSDDPKDLSTMEYHTFLANYKRIIMRSCARLRQNRFAAIVVGDFRDKRGIYRNFVSSTIAAFIEQGLGLYNEAILVTPTGSLPVRIGKQFKAGRKMGKSHQNVLIFVKGDPRKAADACGDVDVG